MSQNDALQKKHKIRVMLSFLRRKYGDDVDMSIIKKRSDLFRLLISTVLSQRAKDETTEIVSGRLFSKVKTPSDVLKMKRAKLESLIRQSGPFRQKAKKIIAISRTLENDYKNSFPRTREQLMALYGVGPKTADIVLSYGYGVPVIAVDVHVGVVSKRLGFAGEKAKYEEIRSSLERLVSESERYIVNLGLVSFGKEICVTRKPKCGICGLKKICAYYNSNNIRVSKSKQRN